MGISEINNKKVKLNRELTLKEALENVIIYIKFLLRKWYILLFFILIGVVVGYFVKKYDRNKYLAETTFVLDEEAANSSVGNSAMQQVLALSGAGAVVGGSGGLFSAKNIIWLYTSRLMIEKTLLTKVKKDKDSVLLVDWFLDMSGMRKEFIDKKYPFANTQFFAISTFEEQDTLSDDQNRIIQMIHSKINKDLLKINKTENADNLVTVSFECKDELFAKRFVDVIVNEVNSFYIDTKTRKSKEHVKNLETRVATMKKNMEQSMVLSAESVDDIPYPNPNLQILKVKSKKSVVDADINTSLYVGLVQALESAQLSLEKQRPLIQVVEYPTLPLKTTNKSGVYMMMIGGIVGGFLAFLIIIFYKLFVDIRSTNDV